MKRIGLLLLAIALWTMTMGTCCAQEKQDLLIDFTDCKPKSWTTRIRVSLMSKSELRNFWIGQQHVIENIRDTYLKDKMIEAATRPLDRQIEALEIRRAAKEGVSPEDIRLMRKDLREDAALDRKVDVEMQGMERSIFQDWQRCIAYTKQQAKKSE